MAGKKSYGGDRALAAGLMRIQKAKRAAGAMKRARSMGLMSHSPSKYGVRYIPAGTSDGIMSYGASYKDASDAQRAKRKADGYYGRGEYWGKGIGQLIGGAIPIPGAGAVFGALGDKVGDWFKRKFSGRGLYEGRGAYNGPGGSNNSLINGGQPNMQFHGASDETSGLTVSHTEYIGDIYGPATGNFSVTSYPLNPGLQEVFPQLSQLAVNFEEYEWLQLVFHFRSTVDTASTNNTSGNSGTIIMATDYSSSVQNFKDKAQMVGSHGAITERMTSHVNAGVECDPSKNLGTGQKLVRTGAVRDRDISTTDQGKFQIAFQNTPTPFNNTQIGELWCTYAVRFDKPRIYSAAAGGVSTYRAVSKGGEVANTTTGVLGTNMLTALGNSLAMAVVGNTQNAQSHYGVLLTFPAAVNGVFEVTVSCEGTAMSFAVGQGPTDASFTRGGTVALYKDMYASALDAADTPSAWIHSGVVNPLSGIFVTSTIHIQVGAAIGTANNTIFVPLFNAATTITQVDVRVMEISPFHAQSSANPAPLFINSLGVIESP